MKRQDGTYAWLSRDWMDAEERPPRSATRGLCLPRRVELEPRETGVGRHQVDAFARLEKIVDDGARESVIHAIVREAVTVEAREALARGEPDEPA